MMGSQERQREKPNQLKEQQVKSLKFFKPTLATTLAIVLAWLLSVRPAQAGYIVTLQQVGSDVVATGSGAIDLTGLTFTDSALQGGARVFPNTGVIITGSNTDANVDEYGGFSGPLNFGTLSFTEANSGSGDRVGIAAASGS